MKKYISIASMNCRGLANAAKRRDVFHFLRGKDYSIYCLQDVHFVKDMEKMVRAEWGLDCYFSSYKSNARGVAVLFNNNFEFKVKHCKIDMNGNMIVIDMVINDCEITLINLYGPNTDDPMFYDNIYDVINDFDNQYVVMCGDWNLVMNEDIDTYNYVRANNPRAKKRVVELCNSLNLVDV